MSHRHRRRRVWRLSCLLILSLVSSAAADDRPNILLLITDDQQWDALHALGNDRIHTPHLDALVARGTTFTHCYNEGGWHGALCVASRAMIHTGRHVWNCGGDHCGEYPVLGGALRNAGYDTFMVGKWHNGPRALKESFAEIAEAGPGFLPSTPKTGEAYARPAEGNTWHPVDPKWKGHWIEREGKTLHSSEHWANETIEYLASRKSRDAGGKPFFAYISFNAPHDPRQAPQRFLEMYPPASIPLPLNFLPEHPFDQGDAKVRDELLAPFPRTEDAVRLHIAEYYAIISHLDEQIGRILQALREQGIEKETVVICTSDQGLAVGQHGLLGKQNLYDHSTRVFLTFAGAEIPAGRTTKALVHLGSLHATICDLAGANPHETVLTPSLQPIVTGKKSKLHETIYAGYRNLQRMVRDDRFKLILYPQVREVQLFDLHEDPRETHNLAADPARRETIQRLHADLLRWMDGTGDPLEREKVTEPWTWRATSLRRPR